MIYLSFIVFLSCLCGLILTLDTSYLVGNAHCADFNHESAKGALTQLKHPFICPALDGIAGTYCKDPFPTRKSQDVIESNLKWSDIVFYVLIGPHSVVDALKWWLQFVKEPIDMVFVGDACLGDDTNCQDPAYNIVESIIKEFPLVNSRLVRALPTDSGYNILSCKLRTGQKLIYSIFPERKYYFKFDTDTIIFPRRLMHFFNTMESIAAQGSNTPLYFGTMVESGIPQLLCKHHSHGTSWKLADDTSSICYCQGGAGYGLSQPVMKHMAGVQSCAMQTPSDLPEDLYTALEVYTTFNHTVPVHCGGFRSSELVNDDWFKQSISFHYIDWKWLKTHGHKLVSHYHEQHTPTPVII